MSSISIILWHSSIKLWRAKSVKIHRIFGESKWWDQSWMSPIIPNRVENMQGKVLPASIHAAFTLGLYISRVFGRITGVPRSWTCGGESLKYENIWVRCPGECEGQHQDTVVFRIKYTWIVQATRSNPFLFFFFG